MSLVEGLLSAQVYVFFCLLLMDFNIDWNIAHTHTHTDERIAFIR